MTYHYNADETEGSVDAGIATVPEAQQPEAESHKTAVEAMISSFATQYGFSKYNASVNGSHATDWVSVNVMLTRTPEE